MSYTKADNIPITAGGALCCDCTKISIGYTQVFMLLSSQQTLTASGVDYGIDPDTDLEWSLSGGGSLSASTGEEVILTAPASNVGCTDNGTVTLTCKGDVIDTQAFSYTSNYSPGSAAYTAQQPCDPVCWQSGSCYCSCAFQGFNCAGVQISTMECTGTNHVCRKVVGGVFSNLTCTVPSSCEVDGYCSETPEAYLDERSEEMKNNSCCPRPDL